MYESAPTAHDARPPDSGPTLRRGREKIDPPPVTRPECVRSSATVNVSRNRTCTPAAATPRTGRVGLYCGDEEKPGRLDIRYDRQKKDVHTISLTFHFYGHPTTFTVLTSPDPKY